MVRTVILTMVHDNCHNYAIVSSYCIVINTELQINLEFGLNTFYHGNTDIDAIVE